MTVIKPNNIDAYKSNQRVNQSQQPSPEPSTSPSSTLHTRHAPVVSESLLTQINEQEMSPTPAPRRSRRNNPGWMSPIRRHRSNYKSSPRLRPASLPLLERKTLPQQPQYQQQAGKPVAFSQAELQHLHSQLLKLSQQQQQQRQQQQLASGSRQAFSEPDLYFNDMEVVDTENRSRKGHPNMDLLSVQYRQEPIPTIGNSIVDGSNISNTKGVADKNTEDTQMDQELEDVRRAIVDASEEFREAARKLQHAQEKEEAIMFEHERRGLGGLPMTANEEGSIADHPSLYSKDSSRTPSIYEPYPLFPQGNQQFNIQNLQLMHELQYSQARPLRYHHTRPHSSSTLVREFAKTPNRRTSPMQIVESTPLVSDHQCSPTRVPQLSDVTGGRESSFISEEDARQTDSVQSSIHNYDMNNRGSTEGNSVRDLKLPSPRAERSSQIKDNSTSQQRKGSPQVKVKSEDKDWTFLTPLTPKRPSQYRDFSIPIEIPSSETDVGTDVGEERVYRRQARSTRTGPQRNRAARWRSPTPIPIRRNSKNKQKKELQQPKCEESLGSTNSNSRKLAAATRPTRSSTPRTWPYPHQPSGRAASSSPRPQSSSQAQGQSRSNESQDPNQRQYRTASPSIGVHPMGFSEFLNSINQHPQLQSQVSGSPTIILYTNIERVENFHNYQSTLSTHCPRSSDLPQHEGLNYEEEGREDDGSMEEDEERYEGSEVGSDKMESGAE
ncbi:hypothetical protein BGZ76_011583 [Entomortierella beljakovae]|nr:hypothetical protein BGZ76_011583 [Entomortierella beljakovae]